jgi:hypothetical protein
MSTGDVHALGDAPIEAGADLALYGDKGLYAVPVTRHKERA